MAGLLTGYSHRATGLGGADDTDRLVLWHGFVIGRVLLTIPPADLPPWKWAAAWYPVPEPSTGTTRSRAEALDALRAAHEAAMHRGKVLDRLRPGEIWSQVRTYPQKWG